MSGPKFSFVNREEVPTDRQVAKSQFADAIAAAINNPGSAVRLDDLTFNGVRALREEARRTTARTSAKVTVTSRIHRYPDDDRDDSPELYVAWVLVTL